MQEDKLQPPSNEDKNKAQQEIGNGALSLFVCSTRTETNVTVVVEKQKGSVIDVNMEKQYVYLNLEA